MMMRPNPWYRQYHDTIGTMIIKVSENSKFKSSCVRIFIIRLILDEILKCDI